MNKQYFVGFVEPWQLDRDYANYFSNKEKAIARARTKAWQDGEDVYVYETVAKISKPDLVNTAKVEAIN